MAQDFPPASDPGYPQEGGGPHPAGYDYQQQAWYPAEQQPYDGSAQPGYPVEPQPGAEGQPWQWSEQQLQGYQQGAEFGYQADPMAVPGGAGYPVDPGYGETPAYEDPFGTATMPAVGADGFTQHGFAPNGFEQNGYEQNGFEQGAFEQGGFDPAGGGPTEAELLAGAPTATFSPVPDDADAPDDLDDPDAGSAGSRSRRGSDDSGSGGSVLDRARAAAQGALGTVLATDGAPGRRTLLIRVAAGVAALGVLVTAGVVATSGGSSHHDAPPVPTADPGFAIAHNKIWAAQPAAAAAPGTDDTLVGSWVLPSAVVRADGSGVHAYDVTTGKPTWSLDAPTPGLTPCDLSPTVNSAGIGGVLYHAQPDPKSGCTLLAAVDTKAGKIGWTKSLSGNTPYAAQVAVTEDKVIAVGDDHVAAWTAANGQDAWQYGGQGKFCTLSGSAAGTTVLLHSACSDSNPADQVVALGAADGKPLWAKPLATPPKTATVLSAEPAVMLVSSDQGGAQVLAWGQNGDPAATIPVADPNGGAQLNVAHGTFDATPGVFFQDHTMVTTAGAPGGPTAAVAYDLATGKQLWRTPVTEKGGVAPIGLDGGSLVLAAEQRVDQPAHLSRFALTTGQEAVGGGFPPTTGSLLTAGRVLIGSDRVIAVPNHSGSFGIATAFQAKG
ncbi:PQQ-binding-like beta-propeller repeat protein [Kitasatospora sp. LaBMicrA B282]|uniref:outer membrane protein assembly factor BamB family protein n=1 Tax=Kitasatospora sp. LaBMicrA B282 TaxID=3420949 RepID=UPI003D09950D